MLLSVSVPLEYRPLSQWKRPKLDRVLILVEVITRTKTTDLFSKLSSFKLTLHGCNKIYHEPILYRQCLIIWFKGKTIVQLKQHEGKRLKRIGENMTQTKRIVPRRYWIICDMTMTWHDMWCHFDLGHLSRSISSAVIMHVVVVYKKTFLRRRQQRIQLTNCDLWSYLWC